MLGCEFQARQLTTPIDNSDDMGRNLEVNYDEEES